jgi:hypothetical protein
MIAQPESLERQLVAAQRPDGGWGYGRGSSWTEPTALAALALRSGSNEARHGVQWLVRTRRADGGYAPHPSVPQSNWTTSLALLALHHCAAPEARPASLWLVAEAGGETSFFARFMRRLRGESNQPFVPAWPWNPGTAGWVMPTALAIASLQVTQTADSAERILSGQKFLVERAARAGGWNHGSMRVFDIEGEPYPETTGVALIGLRGVRNAAVDKGMARAQTWIRETHSTQTWAWLKLGLLAQGIDEPSAPPIASPRSPLECALTLLALNATVAESAFWRTA